MTSPAALDESMFTRVCCSRFSPTPATVTALFGQSLESGPGDVAVAGSASDQLQQKSKLKDSEAIGWSEVELEPVTWPALFSEVCSIELCSLSTRIVDSHKPG